MANIATLENLETVLFNCWSRETSSDPAGWTPLNPAYGQCAVTSVIINDYFGGKIVWANAILPDGREISHYFNEIDGMEIDLTKSQFPKGTVIPKGVDKKKGFSSTRDYVLSFPSTEMRYLILKQKITKK